ncbi:MAG: M20/M25/M40 family metallo-hydrolase [Planctomycetota bacterium]
MNSASRFLRLLPPALAVLAASSTAQVPDDVAAAIKREGLENSQAMALLDHLTNEIGHRLTGSSNYTRACLWAKEQFEAMGLEVELEPWATWRNGWNRGQWTGRVVSPVDMELQIATPAWTAGTAGRVSGQLLPMPTTEEELAELGDALDGAYLFDLRTIPSDEPPADGERRRGRGRRRGGVPDFLREVAAERGVAGFVSSSRGTDEYPNRIRVFADRRASPWLARTLPTIPEIVVRQDQAKRLRWLMNHSDDVEVEFDIRNRFQGEVELHNVVAELKGTEKPDEYVVVCGHLDSWHQATGTTDNGTGATSTMEAARILTAIGAKPRRTIRFCLWGGEEQGLMGSREHVNRRREEMERISCALNHDTGTNWAHRLTVTEAMEPLMAEAMAHVMTLTPPDPEHEGDVFDLRSRETISAGGGSDHASFGQAGVPGLGWGLTGRSDYFNYTWHTQWDTFDVAIPEYQRHTATVIALTALGVANLPELLPREGVKRGRGAGDATAMLSQAMDVEMDGLTFKSVTADGMAAKAGIQTGDRLLKVNGQAVKRMSEMFPILREAGFDKDVELTLQRGDTEAKAKLNFAGGRGGRDRPRGRRRRI